MNINILHISDMHCTNKDADTLYKNLESDLLADIETQSARIGGIDFVVFTGDLTRTGRKEEYELFEARMGKILQKAALQGHRPRFFAVPGNHDLRRPDPNKAEVRLLTGKLDKQTRTSLIQRKNNSYKKVIQEAFKDYSDWHKRMGLTAGADYKPGLFPGDFRASFVKDGIRVCIVGLNTAFLALKDSKKANLALFPNQLRHVCQEGCDDCEDAPHLCLLLTHHPPEWLGEYDKDVFYSEIDVPGRFAMHMVGHMHEARALAYWKGGAGQKLLMMSSSLFGLKTWGPPKTDRIHGYSMLQLSIENDREAKLRIWPRKACKREAGNWRFDRDTRFEVDRDDNPIPIPIGLRPRKRKQLPNESDSSDGLFTGAAPKALSDACPFAGRTRILYTCRSFFERPRHFICPDARGDQASKALRESKTIASHVPVDEFETLGLCFWLFGDSIFGKIEENARESVACSVKAGGLVNKIVEHIFSGDPGGIPRELKEQTIPDILMDNLIVIGENNFSNNLFRLIAHEMPWRHTPIRTEVVVTEAAHDKGNFKVQLFYSELFDNRLDPSNLHDMTDPAYDWGLISFSRNPFAPGKWILYLVGASRPGQYLLLHWLKSPRFAEIIREIAGSAAIAREEAFPFQVVVRGRHRENCARGMICREWETQEIVDTGDSAAATRRFFRRSARTVGGSKIGDPITDLSLLATVDRSRSCLTSILKSLPASLHPLCNREGKSEGIGFHVTLYEFLHTRTTKEHGDVDFVQRLLISGKEGFLFSLKERFREMPPIHALLRQTRVTDYSVQVLVDIYSTGNDLDNYLGSTHSDGSLARALAANPGLRRIFESRLATAMDIITMNCKTVEVAERRRFNIDAAPSPLHITLLRFDERTSDSQRSDAKRWAKENEGRIWGVEADLPIFLTRALEFPFKDVKKEKIRGN